MRKSGDHREQGAVAPDVCPRCGRPMDFVNSALTMCGRPEELCARCLTGHGMFWMEPPRNPNRFGRWLHCHRWYGQE
jgi:hypothetical protein